jgi:hypothetical protein
MLVLLYRLLLALGVIGASIARSTRLPCLWLLTSQCGLLRCLLLGLALLLVVWLLLLPLLSVLLLAAPPGALLLLIPLNLPFFLRLSLIWVLSDFWP